MRSTGSPGTAAPTARSTGRTAVTWAVTLAKR